MSAIVWWSDLDHPADLRELVEHTGHVLVDEATSPRLHLVEP